MILNNLNTERLTLIPINYEIASSLLDNDKSVLNRIGLEADVNWPTEDTMDILPIIQRTLRDSLPSGFETWMIVNKETCCVIGDIGFHGKPNEKGEAEVGFGLASGERGKGYGFEALKAILSWAVGQQTVKTIIADCLIDNKPSARILEKAGMRETKRDEKLIYWEYVK